jgi:hypothetical protein
MAKNLFMRTSCWYRPVADSGFDPGLRSEVVSPGFEGAPPAQIVRQVSGGDAVEAIEPPLEAAVVGVDVVDVQMKRSIRSA